MSDPLLSVVLTIVEGEPAISRCLQALADQQDAPSFEVLVPFDDTVKETARLAARFPQFTFMSLGPLIPTATPKNAFEEHELFDRRRAEGMKAARGRFIAILEDRGAPKADWARAMIEEHAHNEAAAIGGGIENAAQTSMGRALFACDCGRYQPPFQEGEVEYASDLNICYTREALESVRHLWTERYQETRVNWALRDAGKRLLLSSRAMIVHNRGPQKLSRVLGERMHWGRVFAIQRGERWTRGRSLIAAAAAVVLPAILLLRHTRAMKAKGWSNAELMSAVPSFLMILPAWSFGEVRGYLDAAFSWHRARPGGKSVSTSPSPGRELPPDAGGQRLSPDAAASIKFISAVGSGEPTPGPSPPTSSS